MKIPKILKKNNKKYKLVKIYKTYVLYEDTQTKAKECFGKHELGLIKEQEKPRKGNSIFGGY
mgnify:CR=1 FL=1